MIYLMIWSAFLLNDSSGLGGRLFRTEKIVMSERPRLALVGEWREGGGKDIERNLATRFCATGTHQPP